MKPANTKVSPVPHPAPALIVGKPRPQHRRDLAHGKVRKSLRTSVADGVGVYNAAEIRGVSMLGLGETGTVRASAAASSARRGDLYQRYAEPLYRQALLALDDPVLAQQVVCDVIVDECALAPMPGPGKDDERYRLAESVFRCCNQLAADPAPRSRRRGPRPSGGVVGCVDPARLLGERERGVLGLVLFGGLGYVRASAVLGIDPPDMATLLRAILLRLAPPPTDGAQV